MKQANQRLRDKAAREGIPLYMIGRRFGVNDGTFSRWLRVEFTAEKTALALRYIDELAEARRRGDL